MSWDRPPPRDQYGDYNRYNSRYDYDYDYRRNDRAMSSFVPATDLSKPINGDYPPKRPRSDIDSSPSRPPISDTVSKTAVQDMIQAVKKEIMDDLNNRLKVEREMAIDRENKLKSHLEILQKACEALTKQLATEKDEHAQTKRTLEQKIQDIVDGEQGRLQGNLTQIRSSIGSCQKEVKDLAAQNSRQESAIASIVAQSNTAKGTQESVTALTNQMYKLEKSLDSRVAECEKKTAGLAPSIEQLLQTVKSHKACDDKITTTERILKAQIAASAPLASTITDIQTIKSRLGQLQADMAECQQWKASNTSSVSKITALEKSMASLNKSFRSYTTLVEELGNRPVVKREEASTPLRRPAPLPIELAPPAQTGRETPALAKLEEAVQGLYGRMSNFDVLQSSREERALKQAKTTQQSITELEARVNKIQAVIYS